MKYDPTIFSCRSRNNQLFDDDDDDDDDEILNKAKGFTDDNANWLKVKVIVAIRSDPKKKK